MNDHLKNIERIEKYFEGTSSSEEQRAFEKEIQTNPLLEQEVELYKRAVDALKAKGLRHDLKNFHDDLYGNSSNRWKYYAAAAACLALLVTAFLLLQTSKQSHEKLFMKFFQPYPNLITTRAQNGSDFQPAMEYYNKGVYDSALIIFKQKESLEVQELFYKSICLLATERPNEAITSFEKLVEADSKFIQQTTWYIALAHLKNNNTEKALSELSKISPNDYKYGQAVKLIKEIKSN